MAMIDAIMKANEAYVHSKGMKYAKEDPAVAKLPAKHLAIVTCMDTRLVNMMENAMGLQRGDANVIKVAGNVIEPFGDVMRSILVSVYELGANEVIVVGHDGCGMEKTTAASLADKMKQRGIDAEAIADVYATLERWADSFTCAHLNVEKAVQVLRAHPLLPKDVSISGCIMNPATGELTKVDTI